jgi:hypothetical protein
VVSSVNSENVRRKYLSYLMYLPIRTIPTEFEVLAPGKLATTTKHRDGKCAA